MLLTIVMTTVSVPSSGGERTPPAASLTSRYSWSSHPLATLAAVAASAIVIVFSAGWSESMPSTKMRCCFTGIPTVFARRAQMKLIALLPPTVVRKILLPSAPMTQTVQTGLRNFLPARRETTTAMAVLQNFEPASFLVSKSRMTFTRSCVS